MVTGVVGILDTEDFTNIGLVLDMSNGTSEEEEYDDEEEDWGEILVAACVQATDGTGCRRWKGGCVIEVVGTMVVVPAFVVDDSWKGLTGLRSGDSGYFVWCSMLLIKLPLFWLCCNEVKFVAALTMADRLFGDGKLPEERVPPVDEAELSPLPPLWSSLPHPQGQ